ncbi:hypothetical protein [Halalkalibacterium halodurans]|uniref:hypothetical protein n=1 Tax=Halalkalibacterium halodurans TaxID=86665 RepID=UPI000A663777|nr:hypothetical protein [Halalkalibacterium halodurans]TPE70295.1 hypothetical protein AMD02_003650 [Halalkalibacterium halodurans]
MLLSTVSTGELVVLVYLASTLSSCAVTLSAVKKEMGASFAVQLSMKQIITSLISGLLLLAGYRFFF